MGYQVIAVHHHRQGSEVYGPWSSTPSEAEVVKEMARFDIEFDPELEEYITILYLTREFLGGEKEEE